MTASSSHGATIAYEQDPTLSPGVFTTIAEVNDDLSFGTSRGVTETTPHDKTIDYKTPDGRLMRDDFTFSVNFIFDNATHEPASTGVQYIHYQEPPLLTGFRIRVKGGSTGSGEWIASGYVIGFVQTHPVREGAQSAEITIAWNGPMIVDGTTIGN